MELAEALRRVFGHHWKAVVVLGLLGGVVGYLISSAGQSYTASTRVVLDMPDPTSVSEATVISDTARAIVTAPGPIQSALESAHVTADPVVFAREDVAVSSLGSSGIVELSATADNPTVAARIANSLAASLVRTRQQISGRSDALTRIDTTITHLREQIGVLDAKLAAARPPVGSAAHDLLVRRRSTLAQQEADLEAQRSSLLVAGVALPRATVLDQAAPPTRPDPSPLAINVALGLVLGSMLGVAFAAGVETLRPTISGGSAQAAFLSTPLLGEVELGREDGFDAMAVLTRLRIAASSAGQRTVALVPATPAMDLTPVAERLREAVEASGEEQPVIEVLPDVRPHMGLGYALVAPYHARQPDLIRAGDLPLLAKSPLLGLITVRQRGAFRGARRHAEAGERTEAIPS
jgi:capsular polysaccharide biosynthesis protein